MPPGFFSHEYSLVVNKKMLHTIQFELMSRHSPLERVKVTAKRKYSGKKAFPEIINKENVKMEMPVSSCTRKAVSSSAVEFKR